MAYVPTIEDMLANAYNNWSEKPSRTIAYPQTTIEQQSFDGMKAAGYVIISLDCITSAELKRAMESYHRNTDWSAFKQQQWQTAMDSLS